MAVSIVELSKDSLLNYIKNNASQLCVCDALPTTRTEAATTYNIASVNISASDIILSTSVENRLATVAEKDFTFVGSETAIYLAIISGSELLVATSLPSTLVNTDFTIGSWTVTVNDPTL